MADRRASYAWFMATRVAPQVYTGPVERRDPASYQQPSEHQTWRCANPHCGQWTMREAWRTGRCNFCQTPRPAPTPSAPAAATATRRAR